MPQAMKILDATAAVEKEWNELETIPASNLEKVKSRKGVILEARRDKQKVHFFFTDGYMSSRMRSWNQPHRSTGGSCSGEILSKRTLELIQMIAAKIMGIIARLPGCDGQAADAVSSKTLVQSEDALKKIPNRNVQMFGYVFHDTNGHNHGQNEDPVIFLERNLYGHP